MCVCVTCVCCRETTELIQHPNGAAPTCHTEFAVDRGCPWEKAKKLLDEEVRQRSHAGVGRGGAGDSAGAEQGSGVGGVSMLGSMRVAKEAAGRSARQPAHPSTPSTGKG
jgi:hypothetical protein